jgi:hypothetical protein
MGFPRRCSLRQVQPRRRGGDPSLRLRQASGKVEVVGVRNFIVAHRALRPGQDSRAQAEDGEVALPLSQKALPIGDPSLRLAK